MGVNGASSRSREPRRAYYPSGPWIDGIRPAESYDSKPGVHVPEPKPAKLLKGNPDPEDWEILRAEEVNGFLLVEIQYPNCTNFEGKKILVYHGVTLLQLVNQRVVDPHFFEHEKLKAPVARFVPTEQGWAMAKAFATVWVY